MADCGASGTALDRAAAAFVTSATGLGGRAAAAQASSSAAIAAARSASGAVASLVGGTAATAAPASLVGGGGGGAAAASLILAAPPERLTLPGEGVRLTAGGRLDGAWDDAGGGGALVAAQQPARHVGMGMGMGMPPPVQMAPPHPHMMQQHQQEIMMARRVQMMQMQQMQQVQMMQMQQMQMQQQQQQQRMLQEENAQKAAEASSRRQNERAEAGGGAVPDATETANAGAASALDDAASEWHAGLEEEMRSYAREAEGDDVATTADGEYGHEGLGESATIERLAAAWAEAEAEYAAEYDASDMAAARYGRDLDGGGWGPREAEPRPYEFSEASRTHLVDRVASTAEAGTAADRTARADDVDLFSEGMRRFEAGDIADAILAFESHLQNVDPDSSDAWRMLGRCHAENDEDPRAIACLERAVERDPYSPEALLALGVSHVNELDHARALESLRGWISHNPSYAGMELTPELVGGGTAGEAERSSLEELKNLLQRAMGYEPLDAADALEALGVVCNVSREYDFAVDSFNKALESRPDDYQLWNKLGATLANSGRSSEALPAYHRALAIKPKYARAWLNMAISHSNLKNYDEAARCYLQTLSLNPQADHVWSYLRIALTSTEQWDLLPLAAARNLEAFSEHFDFVKY